MDISKKCTVNCMFLSLVARLHRRLANAPTSDSANHDNHMGFLFFLLSMVLLNESTGPFRPNLARNTHFIPESAHKNRNLEARKARDIHNHCATKASQRFSDLRYIWSYPLKTLTGCRSFRHFDAKFSVSVVERI